MSAGARPVMAAVLALSLAAAVPGRAADHDDPASIYAALARRPDLAMAVGGGTIEVVFVDGGAGLDRALVEDWIRAGAIAVSTYFGRFPVTRVGILVVAEDGGRVGTHGVTYGFDGAAIRVGVGRQATADAFRRDWVLVHEMIHLALPYLGEAHAWAMEGSAVYLEPIARAQAGQLSPEGVWRDSLAGMPKGEPRPGDGGLAGTTSWGRTYWGGATFYLLADIAIRQQTDGRKSLQDALRAINKESGGNGVFWPMEKFVAVGDAATGTEALATLYRDMGSRPVAVDLDSLFARLGVSLAAGQVSFDDNAPLAALRRSLTAAPAPTL